MQRPENISNIRINSGVNNSNVSAFSSSTYGNLFYPYVIDSAGDTFVSLTIDIINKNIPKEHKFYNEKLINKDRNRQSIPSVEDKWGFIETSNPNDNHRNISNAFCFCGQKIQFYIATKDQDVGYFDNQFVYCKTRLIASVVDIANGNEEILKTFDSFEIGINDDSRFFTWEVPTYNNTLYSTYGVYGVFVIRLDIERTFYVDSEFSTPINDLYPNKNQSLLQLLAYSAPMEALDVDSTISWLNNKSFSSTDTIENVFDHTIISGLEDSNLPLTDDQKRAIVADQVAFLFIAQHPVITADYYPSFIVGLGVNQNVRSETIIQNIKTYAKRYPDVIDMAKSRLFGLLATYQKYNFISDIESCFNDYTQSLQSIRDPVKTIFIDRNGYLNTEYGINGILLNPYVVNSTEVDIPTDVVLQKSEQITFSKSNVDIDNISVTNIDGSTIDPDTKYVLVSFNITSGEEDIARIRYTLWTSNNLNMFEYTDEVGTSRYHVFDCEGFGNVLYSSDTGEIVFVRIDIEDKNEFVQSFYAEKFFSQGPGFTTIEAFQRQDGSSMVDVYYDYFGMSEINNTQIDVLVSADGGITWQEITDEQLRGDFGTSVMPGRNHITWQPDESQGFGSYVFVKLTLSDVDSYQNTGKESNIAVVRFDRPVVAIRKLTDEEEEEMWMSTSTSTSSSSLDITSSSSIDSSSSSSSSFADEWIPKGTVDTRYGVAISADGSRITTGAGSAGEDIYVSTDYGNTWTPNSTNGDWKGFAMSSDGQIQIGASYNDYVYVSTDYGNTWTPRCVVETWVNIAMSSNGKFQTALNETDLYISTDYGNTWNQKTVVSGMVCVAMSSDGQIQSVTSSTASTGIWMSYDYGNTWRQVSILDSVYSICMSSDGKILLAASVEDSWPIYKFLISHDYGNTWNFTGPSVSSNSLGSCMTPDGSIQTVSLQGEGLYISNNYGVSWEQKLDNLNLNNVRTSSDGNTQVAVGNSQYIYVYRRE